MQKSFTQNFLEQNNFLNYKHLKNLFTSNNSADLVTIGVNTHNHNCTILEFFLFGNFNNLCFFLSSNVICVHLLYIHINFLVFLFLDYFPKHSLHLLPKTQYNFQQHFEHFLPYLSSLLVETFLVIFENLLLVTNFPPYYL